MAIFIEQVCKKQVLGVGHRTRAGPLPFWDEVGVVGDGTLSQQKDGHASWCEGVAL